MSRNRDADESPERLAADERALREAQVVRDRLVAGAPADDPLTREALAVLTRELTELGHSRH